MHCRRSVGSTAAGHCLQQQQQRRPTVAVGVYEWQRNAGFPGRCTITQRHQGSAVQSRRVDRPVQQQQQLVHTAWSMQLAAVCVVQCCTYLHKCPSSNYRCSSMACHSSTAGSQPLPDPQLTQEALNQQQLQQQLQAQEEQGTSRPPSPSATPHLMHMQPPPQPISVPPMLGWMPPQLLLHLKALANFLSACWDLLPEFVSPSLPEALRRLMLVLGASLVLVVVVSTIDSGWLYMYLLSARHVPVAA